MFLFNGYDVSKEVSYMRNAFITGDFKKLGYLFGSAYDTYAPKDPGPFSKSSSKNSKSIMIELKRDDGYPGFRSSNEMKGHFYTTLSIGGKAIDVQVTSFDSKTAVFSNSCGTNCQV
jgi:hypothetical protein